uniref:Uncharacterized protein n=1 Tax=Plectus sambesii TaxID=2011161 RepID=A0A914V4H2_9BILA
MHERIKNYWVTDEYYTQVSLFLSQVTSRTIGISCAGFFFLSKQFMLTLISVIITYFTLMLQMDISASSVCECNCGATSENTTMI